MAKPFHSYTPRGVKGLQGSQTGSMVSAGSRAQIRHGIASAHSSMVIGDGLHAWDMALRQDAGPLVRETFIKDTECDMHDAVSHHLDWFLPVTNLCKSSQAVALDRVTGGFTIVLHCRGSAQTSTSPPLPEEMEFTAYITRDEIEQHAPKFDAAIARMAQIFAADIMPHHSKNYKAKCTSSSVATDTAVIASRVASMQTPLLIPPALFASSMYTFQGYHPGYLESFLLRPVYNTIIAHSNAAIRGKNVKQSLPSPAVTNRAIDQTGFQTPRPQLSKVSRSSNASSPTKPSSAMSPAHIQQLMMKSFINSQSEDAVGCGIAKDEKGKGVMKKKSRQTPPITPSTSRLARLETALSQATRFGSPSSSTLFSSPSLRRGGSRSSISSVSTTDYWVGEDESIFQGDADPSVTAISLSGSSPLKGKGPLALPSTPPVLIPIISVGSKTETAVSESGLPDSVHSYLRNLVATRVTTAWMSNLQGPPLSLSATTAEKLYRAVLHDMGIVL
jgi:hypothetical protein